MPSSAYIIPFLIISLLLTLQPYNQIYNFFSITLSNFVINAFLIFYVFSLVVCNLNFFFPYIRQGNKPHRNSFCILKELYSHVLHNSCIHNIRNRTQEPMKIYVSLRFLLLVSTSHCFLGQALPDGRPLLGSPQA